MAKQSGSSKPPPPSSTTRANDLYSACGALSSDGAAAVLAYASTLIDKNRRFPSVLQHLDRWKFISAVKHVAAEMKEFVFVKSGKYPRQLVFIASLHRALQARGDAATMSLAAFKTRLLQFQTGDVLCLERCRHTKGVSPLLLEASLIQGPRGPLHLMERNRIINVKDALDHIRTIVPDAARPAVASFARRVHADEIVRDGRPRLMTLEPEKFAARIQEFVNRNSDEMSVCTVYWKLEERGEMTGIDFESFKNRILSAQRTGRLQLREGSESHASEALFLPVSTRHDDPVAWSIVRRTTLHPPIPWGPPNPPIIRRLVLHAP